MAGGRGTGRSSAARSRSAVFGRARLLRSPAAPPEGPRRAGRSRLRTLAIAALIVLSIAAQVSTNLDVGYLIVGESAPAELRQAATAVNYARWALHQFAWNVSLTAYWRMFSPVHRYNWRYRIEALYLDGTVVLLPLPNQSPRGFWEQNFVDFRETKLLLNMWTRPPMRAAYAEYLCRTYPRGEARPLAIRYTLEWQHIVPPERAIEIGRHLESDLNSTVMDQVRCRR